MPIPVLQDAQLSALTQVCNLGMVQAATALSQMMGKKVNIEVPRLQVLEPDRLPALYDRQEVICLNLQIVGQVRGSIMIVLLQENAHCILGLLLGRSPEAGAPLSELELSTLNEVGNILASACLNALGSALKMQLLPSVPALTTGAAQEVLAQLLAHPDGDAMVMIDTDFSIADSHCGGSIFLLPESASLQAILGAAGER